MNELKIALEQDTREVKKGVLFLGLDLTIDGRNPMESSGGEDFDVYDLLLTSGDTKTALFIFTCSCGIAGCAGYFEGISVKYNTDTIHWHDHDEGRKYEFVKSKYIDVLMQLSEELIKWHHYANSKKLELKIHPELIDVDQVIGLAENIKNKCY